MATLYGGDTDNDTIFGNDDEDDLIFGLGGDDALYGGTFVTGGSDTIYGGDGNDYISSNQDADELYGGNGNDYLVLDRSSLTVGLTLQITYGGAFTLSDGTFGSGFEAVWFHSGSGDDSANFAPSFAGNWFLAGAGNDTATVDYSAMSSRVRSRVAGGEWIVDSGSLADDANSTHLRDVENLVFLGGSGNDEIYGSGFVTAQIHGNAGADFLQGGNDAGGSDTIYGGEGDDTVMSNRGSDALFGGAGSDFLNLYRGDVLATGLTLQFTYGGTFTLSDGTSGDGFERFQFTSGYGRDSAVIDFSAINLDLRSTSVSSQEWSVITSVGGSPLLVHISYVENLTFFSGSGNDLIYALSFSSAQLFGNAGNDTLTGSGFGDELYGGLGADSLVGLAGHDTISGGSGTDSLYGAGGKDLLIGGSGDDYLAGGLGSDTYVVDSISDVVDEAVDAGTDLVFSYVSLILSSNVEMLTLREAAYAIAGTGNDLGNRITGNSNANALLGLAGNDTLFGEAGDDNIAGGTENDRLLGGAGGDHLWGDDGNDNLYGGEDRDYLYGGAGNDRLAASDGGSRLEGGTGGDRVIGGAGDDLFVFAAGSGVDRVENFTVGTDHIYLSGVATGDVSMAVIGSRLVLSWGTDRVTIYGLADPSSVTLADLIVTTDDWV